MTPLILKTEPMKNQPTVFLSLAEVENYYQPIIEQATKNVNDSQGAKQLDNRLIRGEIMEMYQAAIGQFPTA